MLKHHAALLTGKSISFLTKTLKKGGGSAAPGLYSLKIDPDLISKLSRQIKTNIVITGTNGKTTTSRMIAHFAKNEGVSFIRNSTGSNLERGVASTLITNTNILGKIKNIDLGIWEIDEAAFNRVAPILNPEYVIFLNAFRDQLDRYGEVDSVVKKWLDTLKKINPQTVFLNGDDGNTAQMAGKIKSKIIAFGLKDGKIVGEGQGKGIALDVVAKDIKEDNLETINFKLDNELVDLPLPGKFNVYNFLASFALSATLGWDKQNLLNSLGNLTPAFGRFEKFNLGNSEGYIFLIKNPVGATQVFKTVSPQIKKGDRLLVALNDNFADGTDVSWIWDADFEALSLQSSALRVICSGSRAYDLAVRFKYAGVKTDQIMIEPSIEKAFNDAKEGLKGGLFILPTYTALLSLQSLLAKSGIKQEYWKEKS